MLKKPYCQSVKFKRCAIKKKQHNSFIKLLSAYRVDMGKVIIPNKRSTIIHMTITVIYL